MLKTNSSALIVRPTTTTNAAPAGTNDLRGLKPLVEIPTGWEWLWWTLAALVLAAALVALWRWWRKAAARPVLVPPVPPHLRARQRLQEALRLIGDARLFCIAVSDALRIYLEERFELRAPERTTEEFLQDLQGTPHLNTAQKLSLADFLTRCDLVKFARLEPTEAALRELHESALRLVDETQYEPVAAPPPAPAAGEPAAPISDTSRGQEPAPPPLPHRGRGQGEGEGTGVSEVTVHETGPSAGEPRGSNPGNT